MTDHDHALPRIRTFWRRILFGASIGARIEIYEELAPTLAAGIGVREALRTTAERHSGAKRRVVELLADGVDRDVPLSETMRANPESFTPLEAALLSTGEKTGRLDAAFRSAAAQLDRERSTRNRIVQSLLYPLLVAHCFVLMVGLVLMFRGGSFLKIVVPALLLFWGGLCALASLHAAWADRPGYGRVLERIPVIGRVLRAAALARFARAFAALHGAGVLHDQSLRIAADASGSATLRRDAAAAAFALTSGAPLSSALEMLSSLPSDDRGLLVAGEQSGELEAAANRIAALEEERSDVVTKRASSLLPGCLTLLVGVAVGAFALWFYADYYRELNKMLK